MMRQISMVSKGKAADDPFQIVHLALDNANG
jgi:hypothetical protein